MKKQKLREIYKQQRNNLSEKQIQELQENIYQQVYNLEISKVNNVHLFLSITKFKEIDTRPIITYFRDQNKRIAISKCNFQDKTLSHFYYDKNTVLVLNKFDVPEPINAEVVLEEELDLIFVPLLISDIKNYRVGYGKGFYDRFLSSCRKDAKLIGLNFFKPIEEIEDINEFDIPLQQVIYPK
jgi:5-formyltetrahydrofolate cyclo-ligase